MSSGFITGLMLECLRLSANDFVSSIPPTLGPSSMFSVSIAYCLHLVVAD